MNEYPSELDLLCALCSDAGRLEHVVETPLWENAPVTGALELRFEVMSLWITVDSEFDTILLHTSLPDGIDLPPRQIPHAFWNKCIGKSVRWAWLMTNQKRYTDGIRFEFDNLNSPDPIIIDILAIASGLSFSIATAVHDVHSSSRI